VGGWVGREKSKESKPHLDEDPALGQQRAQAGAEDAERDAVQKNERQPTRTVSTSSREMTAAIWGRISFPPLLGSSGGK
jgi:hypothetical protein